MKPLGVLLAIYSFIIALLTARFSKRSRKNRIEQCIFFSLETASYDFLTSLDLGSVFTVCEQCMYIAWDLSQGRAVVQGGEPCGSPEQICLHPYLCGHPVDFDYVIRLLFWAILSCSACTFASSFSVSLPFCAWLPAPAVAVRSPNCSVPLDLICPLGLSSSVCDMLGGSAGGRAGEMSSSICLGIMSELKWSQSHRDMAGECTAAGQWLVHSLSKMGKDRAEFITVTETRE